MEVAVTMKLGMAVLVTGLAAGFSGCRGSTPTVFGDQMSVYFPLEGTRAWSFVSTNQSVTYKIVARNGPTRGTAERVEHPIRFTKRCVGNDPTCVEGEWIYTQWWTYTDGAYLTAFDSPAGNVSFDPPLQVTTDRMTRDDAITTTTGGATWTSTLVAKEPCPSRWTSATLPDCMRFTITGGDGPVAMTYFFVPDWMVGGFQWADSPDIWQIERATYEEESPSGDTGDSGVEATDE